MPSAAARAAALSPAGPEPMIATLKLSDTKFSPHYGQSYQNCPLFRTREPGVPTPDQHALSVSYFSSAPAYSGTWNTSRITFRNRS